MRSVMKEKYLVRLHLGILLALVCGCALQPLGRDWDTEKPCTKEEKAIAVVSEIFRDRSCFLPHRPSYQDHDIVFVDKRAIVYRPVAKKSPLYILFFADISSIEAFNHLEYPSQPQTLRCYLKRGSLSSQSSSVDVPLLFSVYLDSAVVELPLRAKDSKMRLQAAMEYLLSLRAGKGDISTVVKKIIRDWDVAKVSREEMEKKVLEVLLPANGKENF